MIICKASLSAFAAASSALLRARCFCGSAAVADADLVRKWLSAPAGTNSFVPSGSSLSATSSGPKIPALIATTAAQQEHSHSNERARHRCCAAQCKGGSKIKCGGAAVDEPSAFHAQLSMSSTLSFSAMLATVPSAPWTW